MLADPLGAEGTFPLGINNLEQIVGYYVDAEGTDHGFLATPTSSTPEPGTLQMAIAAILCLASYRLVRWF